MRTILFHNPEAGDGDHSAADCRDMLEKVGYSTSCWSTRNENWREALDEPVDLRVVAGGDGTVAKVLLAPAA